METPSTRLIDRTLSNIRMAWRGLSSGHRESAILHIRPSLPSKDIEVLKEQMRECLEGTGGEVSASARAATLGEAYLDLNDVGRLRFLDLLAKEFQLERDALAKAATALRQAEDEESRLAAETKVQELARPKRVKLLTQFNALPQGVKFLVDMRADLRRLMGAQGHLLALDRDFRDLLRSWFDIGFLDLKQITWNEPASLLEKLITYEAVHEIQSWRELKSRLQGNRRCYAFFHPRMPDEPLIFVQVALINGIADSIQRLLQMDYQEPQQSTANTAVFYSISNTQKGLHGVSFGNFLIKRVVELLGKDNPQLKTYATLSPVPGFRDYLLARLQEPESGLVSAEDLGNIHRASGNLGLAEVLTETQWHLDEQLTEALQGPLMRLCAHYLINEKRNKRALNSVANFHLNNGARLERINWLGDTSVNGLRQSCGVMVNYLYRINDIEKNHERYRSTGFAAAATSVRTLAKSKK